MVHFSTNFRGVIYCVIILHLQQNLLDDTVHTCTYALHVCYIRSLYLQTVPLFFAQLFLMECTVYMYTTLYIHVYVVHV